MINNKYILLAVHTERLHDLKTWSGVSDILRYFKYKNVRATWFSINPTFSGYRAMGHDEGKWAERLRAVKEAGHEIQQHTHFYRGKEGVVKGEGYDMSRDHIEQRLREDKEWLEQTLWQRMEGFVSGAWKINDDLFSVLNSMGYKYDSSFQAGILRHINDLMEIPSTARLKLMLVDFFKMKPGRAFLKYQDMELKAVAFHDYDLASLKFRLVLKLFISLYSMLCYRFISFGDMYRKIREK